MPRIFPKRIGIVWFQGEAQLTQPLFVENIKNWRRINPEWEVVVLDDQMLRTICYQFSKECGETYDRFDIMHQKIDFGRYVCLWETCTMYVDMDCYAFRSIDSSKLLNDFFDKYQTHEHILGVSALNVSAIEKWITNYTINNGVMIASPRNPIIASLIQSIIENNRGDSSNLLNNDVLTVMSTTGPRMINNMFDEWKETTKTNPTLYLEMFPYYVFEPGQPFQNFHITDDTVALHKFELSWLSPPMKTLFKSYYELVKPYVVIFIIAVLVIWSIYKYYYSDCHKRCKVMCASHKR